MGADDYTITGIVWFIMQGAGISLRVYFVTIIFSIPIGILCAVGKLSRFRLLRYTLAGYTWLLRGTPLLLQLFFVYYVLPGLCGIELSAIMAAYITFVFNYAAYFTEIFRGGIQSIDSGQYEAAQALGLNYKQTMRRIVLPQAVKVILPPTGNEAINLIKDTALCATLAIPDILKNARGMYNVTYSLWTYGTAVIIYLLLTFVIIKIFSRLEKRMAYYE